MTYAPKAYMWIGWPPSPRLNEYVAKIEGINNVLNSLIKRGFKGIVIGPWAAVKNPKGRRQYGPFTSDAYRESLRRVIGDRCIKVDHYHPFNPTLRYYEASPLKPRIMPKGIENVGEKYFKEVVKAAYDRGLEIYYLWMLVCHTYGNPPNGAKEIIDVFNKGKEYVCPNTPGLPEYMEGYLRDILDNYPEVSGVILDHLEFPSYVAGEIFTCFCEGCRAKAEEYGYNFQSLKLGALKLYAWIKGLSEERLRWYLENDLSPMDILAELFDYEGFIEWWQFRLRSIKELAKRIQEVVHEVDPSLELNMDSVAPSFCNISGVSLASLSRYSDMLNPKLYPTESYWGWRNRLASYVGFISSGAGVKEGTAFKFLIKLFGLKALSSYRNLDELRGEVFPTELFLNELEKAIRWYGNRRRIRPWVWLEYSSIREIKNMLQAIVKAGVEGAIFKQYSAATEEKLNLIQEELGI